MESVNSVNPNMSAERKTNEEITTSKSYEKLARLYDCYEKLVELEGDINYQVPESSCLSLFKPKSVGNTALHFAVKRRDSNAAKLLIDHGADPTIKNQQSLTPLLQFISCIDSKRFSAKERLNEPLVNLLLAAQVQYQNSTNPKDPHGLSHFHVACMANDVPVVKFFLDNQVSIDEAVNEDSPVFPGYTPLHFAVLLYCSEVANVLLDRGASPHLKDSTGMTPLHLAIQQHMTRIQSANLDWHEKRNVPNEGESSEKRSGRSAPLRYNRGHHFSFEMSVDSSPKFIIHEWIIREKNDYLAKIIEKESFIISILSKVNMRTLRSIGLSPFYVMYVFKDSSLVNNDYTQINVNEEAVDMNSAFWPGYTALHFAAHWDIDTFKLLVERGADIEAKDANGETPFDICVGTYDVTKIHGFISCYSTWREIRLSDANTKLVDLVGAMRNYKEFGCFLKDHQLDINDISVPVDSPLWPSFTILHLAVILTKKCACSHWQEYSCTTPNEMVELCLRFGADVSAQDVRGSTPLHLAFRRMNLDNVCLLLDYHETSSNPVDRDNLSHLHIACAMNNEELVKKLIDNEADVNEAVSSSFQWDLHVKNSYKINSERYLLIETGSTPLHIAAMMASKNVTIVKMLIEAGADLNAKDIYGYTPMHILFMTSCLEEDISEIVVSGPLLRNDCVVERRNYLHDTARSKNKFPSDQVTDDLFTRVRADDNSTVLAWDSTSGKTEKYVLNHETIKSITKKLLIFIDDKCWLYIPPIDTAITRAVEIISKKFADRNPIGDVLMNDQLMKRFTSVMNEEDEIRLIEETGVTKLHMACKLFDEKMIRDCIEKGANVNAQIRNDSKIWPGYTPLHILVEFYDEAKHRKEMCKIVRFLLKSGADIMIADAKGETPILMKISDNHIAYNRPSYVEILMRSLKNTSVNPVSVQGISHFHLACIGNDVGLMEKFLKNGVDPNQTVHYFSNDYPGYTPLHFVVARRYCMLRNDLTPLRAVNLLLKYGAKVNAQDTQDITPLLLAAELPCSFKLPYKRMLRAGADPEIKDIYGRTPAYKFEKTKRKVKRVWLWLPYLAFHFGCVHPVLKLRRAIRALSNVRNDDAYEDLFWELDDRAFRSNSSSMLTIIEDKYGHHR